MLRLQSTAGTALGGTFVIGDHPDATGTGLNDNDDPWADGDRHHLGMWVKNGSALADKTVQITVLVENTAGQVRQPSFATNAGTDGHSGSCVTDYIGTAYNDGQWHYLEFDLAERLFTIWRSSSSRSGRTPTRYPGSAAGLMKPGSRSFFCLFRQTVQQAGLGRIEDAVGPQFDPVGEQKPGQRIAPNRQRPAPSQGRHE